jgi:hypothetical protein
VCFLFIFFAFFETLDITGIVKQTKNKGKKIPQKNTVGKKRKGLCAYVCVCVCDRHIDVVMEGLVEKVIFEQKPKTWF